jgi:hypothetical protein
MTTPVRIAVAGALLLLAWFAAPSRPAPRPPAAGDIVLAGKFAGPAGAADAAVLSALFAELADEIEWDGTQEHPTLATGVAFDELRTRARDFRCRGERIGARQPRVRDAVKSYLESKLGTSGGPVTPEQRAAWVAAFRSIAEAAANATR